MPTLEHGLGRLKSRDERDRRFLMRENVFAQLPPKPRKRPYNLGPTLDQLNTPQCVGFSGRDKLASAPLMMGEGVGPSPVQLYRGAQDNDEWFGNDYDGTSVRGLFKYLQQLGYIKSYVWASSVTDCERFVLGGYGTIIVGTDWTESMFTPRVDGFVTVEGGTVGGHAYHLFWMVPSLREVWFKNSWGPRWGVKLHGRPGCFKMTYDDLDTLLARDGEAGAGIEVKVKAPVVDI